MQPALQPTPPPRPPWPRGERVPASPAQFNSPTPAAAQRATFPAARDLAPLSRRLWPPARRSYCTVSPPRARREQAEARPETRAGAELCAGGAAAPAVQSHRGSHTHRLCGDSSRGRGGSPRAPTAIAALTGATALPAPPRPARAAAQSPATHERPRPPPRAPPVGPARARPAPKKQRARVSPGSEKMRLLPESRPHAGGVGALDLLQDPFVFRDGTQTLAAFRHLGWRLRSRRGAAPRERRGRATGGASAAGGARGGERGGAKGGAGGLVTNPGCDAC
jgi:hypothetical protein